MAKKGEGGVHILMESTESDDTYHTVKNKRSNPGKLELKKYDKILRKKVTFKEVKSSK